MNIANVKSKGIEKKPEIKKLLRVRTDITSKESNQRNLNVARDRMSGSSIKELMTKYNLSKGEVWFIITMYGAD